MLTNPRGKNMQKLIELMTQKMEEREVSQGQLAKKTGTKQQYISAIILGKIINPNLALVVKIADVLDIDLNELKGKSEQ